MIVQFKLTTRKRTILKMDRQRFPRNKHTLRIGILIVCCIIKSKIGNLKIPNSVLIIYWFSILVCSDLNFVSFRIQGPHQPYTHITNLQFRRRIYIIKDKYLAENFVRREIIMYVFISTRIFNWIKRQTFVYKVVYIGSFVVLYNISCGTKSIKTSIITFLTGSYRWSIYVSAYLQKDSITMGSLGKVNNFINLINPPFCFKSICNLIQRGKYVNRLERQRCRCRQ